MAVKLPVAPTNRGATFACCNVELGNARGSFVARARAGGLWVSISGPAREATQPVWSCQSRRKKVMSVTYSDLATWSAATSTTPAQRSHPVGFSSQRNRRTLRRSWEYLSPRSRSLIMIFPRFSMSYWMSLIARSDLIEARTVRGAKGDCHVVVMWTKFLLSDGFFATQFQFWDENIKLTRGQYKSSCTSSPCAT